MKRNVLTFANRSSPCALNYNIRVKLFCLKYIETFGQVYHSSFNLNVIKHSSLSCSLTLEFSLCFLCVLFM